VHPNFVVSGLIVVLALSSVSTVQAQVTMDASKITCDQFVRSFRSAFERRSTSGGGDIPRMNPNSRPFGNRKIYRHDFCPFYLKPNQVVHMLYDS
jgi:hypothetical protein